MSFIKIGEHKISNGDSVFIIAEAADSHYGSMQRAKKIIREAKKAGADCIKFQHHLPDEEMLADIPMSDNFKEPLYEFLKKNALTIKEHEELKSYCEKTGIIYLCTPFSYKAAQELDSIGVEAFKIGSGEFMDWTSLQKIASLKKPMLLSTGMSTMDEVRSTYHFIKILKVPFAFMHCVSEYPPLYEDLNIGVIKIFKKEFPDIVIGYSDHTPDNFTAFAAVAMGAKIIEKHVTLDKRLVGPDQSVSIEMHDLARLVEGIHKIEAALGEKKKLHNREKQIRQWAYRSIITTRDILAGEALNRQMLWTKRPGTGIPSRELPKFIGRKTKRFLKANTLLRRKDVE